jgi:formylmethanofuran dehydrogenase subunit E
MEFGEIAMWVIIDEKKLRHKWECPNCDEYAYVQPWWYSENGTPMCTECDDDMEYIRTEIDIEN